MELKTMRYEVDGRVARITLDRPERGNGITMDMPRELAWCVEQADIDPAVHVMALSGSGTYFHLNLLLVAARHASASRLQRKRSAKRLNLLLRNTTKR